MKQECRKCDFEWISRVDKPKVCPRCKQYGWWRDTNSKCDICERTFLRIDEHHIDGDRKNNSKENIIEICRECHNSIHNGDPSSSKRKNGKSRRTRMRNYKSSSEVLFKINKYKDIWFNSKSTGLVGEDLT